MIDLTRLMFQGMPYGVSIRWAALKTNRQMRPYERIVMLPAFIPKIRSAARTHNGLALFFASRVFQVCFTTEIFCVHPNERRMLAGDPCCTQDNDLPRRRHTCM